MTAEFSADRTASLPGDEEGPPSPTEPLPLRDPGRYLIYEEHARGGIGRILRAEDRDLDRELAIKELLVDDDASRARFVREARLTARLEHPGIVPVHDAGRWSGSDRPFYAMKLVGGRPLKSVVARTHSLEERLPLIRHIVAIAEAIAYAHSRGIIHRDLTPNNVMIGDFGETVVIDWGLAKEVGAGEAAARASTSGDSASDLTQAGSVVGTPAFMAPEQARGEPVDERADVYALGALLYYVVSGSWLYDPTKNFLERVATEPPVPLRRREPRISADLVTIVEKATAREPAERYGSARQLADDLQRYQEGKLVEAHAYTPRELAFRWLRRRRVAAALTLGFVTILAAGGTVSFLREQNLRRVAERERRHAESQSLALLEEYGRRELDAGRPQRAAAYLAEGLRRAPDSRVLRWLLSQAVRPLGAHLRTLRGHTRDVIATAITPDGKLVATGSGDKTVRLWDSETGEERRLLEGHTRMLEDLAFSPDGKLLASADAGRAIRLWRVETGELVREHAGEAFRVAFSADGRQLWIGGKSGLVRAWDVETGQELVNNPWHKERVSALLFPKKGDLAITTSWDGRITVWDLATRTPSRSVEDHHAGVWVARFRDDERYLVTGDEEGTLAIRDGETLEVRHFIRVPATSHATQAWFTPRGDTLVTVAADGSLREWHAASGQPLLTVDAVAHGKVFDATFSPSTGLLATASLRATDLWRIGPSADYRLLGVAEIGPTALGPGEVSADGRRLIAPRKGSDGKFSVRTWDTTSGRLIADWAENATPHSVAVSRNGDRVAVATLDGAPPRLWDGQGRLVAMLEGHERLVYNLAISPDDRLVATASYDRSVRIWRAKDGGPERIIRMELRPTAVAFDPSGPRLAVVDEDGRLSFYDRETGELLERFAAHPTWVQDVEYSRDGTKVVTAGRQDHTAKIWDLAEGRPPILLAGHADNLMRASFSPDGRVVATSSVDDTARIWDTETGELLRTLPGPSTTAAFGPDGHVLYTTGSKDYAVAWELRLDGRSAEELARAVTEGSPWRLENARLTLSEE